MFLWLFVVYLVSFWKYHSEIISDTSSFSDRNAVNFWLKNGKKKEENLIIIKDEILNFYFHLDTINVVSLRVIRVQLPEGKEKEFSGPPHMFRDVRESLEKGQKPYLKVITEIQNGVLEESYFVYK